MKQPGASTTVKLGAATKNLEPVARFHGFEW
jgi:hypothetical protein